MFGLDPKASALHWLGPALWLLGYPDQALTTVKEAVALGRGLSNPFTEAACLDRLSWIHSFRCEWDKAAFEAERTHDIAAQQGAPLYVAAATYWIGLARVLGRGSAEGIEQMRRGMEGLRTLGTLINHPMMLTELAQALGRFGRYDEALLALDEAMCMVRDHREQFWEAELYRVRGETLLALDPSAKKAGEEALTQALDIARQQEARMLELRAATSLARLCKELGRRTEARELLAPVYEWFTEGHETLDLRGAKALLEELGSGERAARPGGARS
jgi:predicted ATPase